MPEISIPRKLLSILSTKARIIVLIGGRGSAKSETIARLLVMKAQSEYADILCGREFQNSIDDSVHKLIKGLIEDKLQVPGFNVTDKKIDHTPRGGFRFKGFARSPDAVKSAQDFKYSWVEEAQTISQNTIDDLIPTIRATDSKLFFTANPRNSNDPFSKRFIIPFKQQLDKDGFYEDNMHLIIVINHRDNPWFPDELEIQRQWDYEHLPRAKYDHIWEGAFNDSIDNALIQSEWFDSCIDAHSKLGFKPKGIRLAAHDPSDMGGDSKGYAMRHGSVVLRVEEMTYGDVNEGCDWATGLTIQDTCDMFTWDCDGMGVTLNRQVSESFDGKRIVSVMFKGSEGPDFPDSLYDPPDNNPNREQKTNREVFKNKRAQYYFALRDRILRTHYAVTRGEYYDPDTMISFSSNISCMTKLRSEICTIPIKPNGNGFLELYPKPDMKKLFKLPSPNLADSVMELMRSPQRIIQRETRKPEPIRSMGTGARR